MCLGLQNHSSKMCCPFGLCHKIDGRWVEGEPRTIRMCKNMHEGWRSQFPDGDKDQLKHYGGCMYPPIEIFPEEKADVPLILLIAPPILHILLGIIEFNYLTTCEQDETNLQDCYSGVSLMKLFLKMNSHFQVDKG